MASTVELWTPPAGMTALNVTAWRTFYARIQDAYGVAPAPYRLLYVAQKGRCWICRVAKGIHPDDPKARGTRRLGIDHNHTTGAVRGLLCTGGPSTCNRIVGWLKDDPETFRRAADYLERPPARVLAEIAYQRESAREAGYELSQNIQDHLATAYLWPETVL